MKAHQSISVIVLMGFFTACGPQEEIQVYRIHKAPAEESAGMPQPPMTDMQTSSENTQPQSDENTSHIVDQAPEGWSPQQLSAMRQASYIVNGKGGTAADVSLIVLGGGAGGVLENVNRWLTQLNLAAITDAQLAKIAQHVKSPLGDVTVVDLQGKPEGADLLKDGRILAGILSTGKNTYFYKMRGNDALVGAQKEAFIKWVSSIKAAVSGVEPKVAPIPMDSTSPHATEAVPEKAKVKWTVPSNWKQEPQTSAMRYATFSITGKEGVEVTVSLLQGTAGGDLDNVNRWRSQVMLAPIQASELPALTTFVKAKDATFSLIDLAGSEKRMLVGWGLVDGFSWFIKLTGPDQAAETEKAIFIKFLQSIQFHP